MAGLAMAVSTEAKYLLGFQSGMFRNNLINDVEFSFATRAVDIFGVQIFSGLLNVMFNSAWTKMKKNSMHGYGSGSAAYFYVDGRDSNLNKWVQRKLCPKARPRLWNISLGYFVSGLKEIGLWATGRKLKFCQPLEVWIQNKNEQGY
ncbi:hypothetical protein L3X38_006141 [Prunus dulcis]|uniref:Uncharacterized protein n=1 Tax=Prunus dulcis TaxID=3755 RepID=A0AAD4ZS43_PRUDU|nr:hypothetical protein L3X38_006141 [Prunus dulcis]